MIMTCESRTAGKTPKYRKSTETPERAARIVQRALAVNVGRKENASPGAATHPAGHRLPQPHSAVDRHRQTGLGTGSAAIACYGTHMPVSSSFRPFGRAATVRLSRRPALCATAALALAMMLSACADHRSRFPSLARRPAERSFAAQSVKAPDSRSTDAASAQPGADLLTRADALVTEAQTAQALFVKRADAVGPRIVAGRNAARGSDAWAAAMVALAELESARSRTGVTLADLDRLLVETTVADPQGTDSRLPALRARHAEVQALVAGQTARIERLRSGLAD